ncbi:hypothetical protein EYF80_035357 [Liparis tanakae]|uniref:Uncharacterized protein n=1 Tax=Liparis tanakae TaxID=230148 RepID=A0A4Z2GLH3_9TELE|nr:hypothetical protein EYF80_035357 [Liparis tanakae]
MERTVNVLKYRRKHQLLLKAENLWRQQLDEPTGEQEQDGVAPAVGALDPLGAQAAVRVGRRHQQAAPGGTHNAVGQEVVFDEAQRAVRGVV